MTELESAAFFLSLKVASISVLVTLPIAILFARLLSRHHFPGKTILDIILHLPMVLPPVVIGFGLLTLFGRNGPLGTWLFNTFQIEIAFTWAAAAIAAGVMALPLMIRAIRQSMDMTDQRLEAMAASLGASQTRVFFTISLPMAMPGIGIAMILGFARALGEFGATIIFAANIPGVTQTLPLAIYTALQTPGGDKAAWSLAIISASIATIALIAANLISRRSRTGAS